MEVERHEPGVLMRVHAAITLNPHANPYRGTSLIRNTHPPRITIGL